jgi:hypothetical protein
MKTLLFVFFISSLSITASAGLSLSDYCHPEDYNSGYYLDMRPGQHQLCLSSDIPFSSTLVLTLYPKEEAHFNPYQTLVPVPWYIFQENGYDNMTVDFTSFVSQPPIYSFVFDITYYCTQYAYFAVLDESFDSLGTWLFAAPEPASLLFLGLGGLLLKMRKK